MNQYSTVGGERAIGPLGHAGDAIKSESTIQRLTSRIEALRDGLNEIGHKLRNHADEVHGPYPEADSAKNGAPCRSGQLGALEDAIDRLEMAVSFVNEQAQRNCLLA